jgi:hypothetical protein
MPKNACLEITSGNFEKSLPTSLFVEKVSMTILELTYQTNDGNKIMHHEEKEVTCDAKGLHMICQRAKDPKQK